MLDCPVIVTERGVSGLAENSLDPRRPETFKNASVHMMSTLTASETLGISVAPKRGSHAEKIVAGTRHSD